MRNKAISLQSLDKARKWIPWLIGMILVFGIGLDNAAGEVTQASVQKAYGDLPLYFIQNDGQVDQRVK